MPVLANLKKLISSALARIFRKPTPAVDPDLWQATYQALDAAVQEGTAEIQHSLPDYKLTQQLLQSAALFAARKSWAQAKALAELAASKEGYRISWAEFLEKAKPIVGDYNVRWLKTEYNMAIRKARQAAKWPEYERMAHIYPNLRYLPSRAAVPREEHKPYYGVVRPIGDDFWVKHMPPSAWGCVCGVEQTDDPVTPLPATGPKAAPGLDGNAGKTGQLFSDSHPYAKAIPEEIRAELVRQARKLQARATRYFRLRTPGGKYVHIHPAHDVADIEQNLATAVQLADAGYKVQLPPHSHEPGVARPDFLLDGKIAELKEPASDRKNLPSSPHKSFKKLIDSAGGQGAEVVVFNFHRALISYTTEDLMRGIPRAFQNAGKEINQTVQTLIIIGVDGNITTITRQKILEGNLQVIHNVALNKHKSDNP